MAEGDAFFSEGILSGTLIAAEAGWCAVETLCPGDLVLTFDGGPVPIVEIHHAQASVPQGDWPMMHWPMQVPKGVLGNRSALRVLPGQLVMLESDLAETMFGDPFALVPARALEPWRGIAPCPPRTTEAAFGLVFETEQLVYANSGVLLHCPGVAGGNFMQPGVDAGRYAPLSLASARELVAAIMAEDVGAALNWAAPKGNQAALG